MDHVKQLEALCQCPIALAGELGQGWVHALLCSKLPAVPDMACVNCWTSLTSSLQQKFSLLKDILTLLELWSIISHHCQAHLIVELLMEPLRWACSSNFGSCLQKVTSSDMNACSWVTVPGGGSGHEGSNAKMAVLQ